MIDNGIKICLQVIFITIHDKEKKSEGKQAKVHHIERVIEKIFLHVSLKKNLTGEQRIMKLYYGDFVHFQVTPS